VIKVESCLHPAAFLLLIACESAAAAQAPPTEALNVILVMSDDQGYCDLGVHGNPVVRTPHLDALARDSVRFTDFHVNPFCAPTRAALLTGRMSDRTGVTRTNYQRNYLRRDEVLMPEFFRASGYRTGIFGKWHVGGNYPYRPIDRGFERWVGLGNNGLATTADFWDNDRLDDSYWVGGQPARIDGFCTDVYFDQAMHFMDESQRQGKPFFAYIATNVPHWDWNVRPEWLEAYRDYGHHERACFYASIERVDWNIGRLVDFLSRSGLERNTLLVFLTDNGSDVPEKESAFSAGMRGWKCSLYEGGHRVPCFIRGPRELVNAPRDIDAFTAHIDLLPTLVDLCELKQPPRPRLPWDGRSLRPLLQGQVDWPDRLLVMHFQNGLNTPAQGRNAVVMTADWRLVNGKELYDIRKDPGQKQDVATEHPHVVARLQKAYADHWSELELEKRPLERPLLGSFGSPTLKLTPDLTRDSNFIWQQNVRKGDFLRHPLWLVEVEQAGTFRFEIRRWPREVDQPMTGELPPTKDSRLVYCGHADSRIDVPGKALAIAEVELKLSWGRDLPTKRVFSRTVGPHDKRATFEVRLPAGPLDLEAWFLDQDGRQLTGAYYVYAEPLSPEQASAP
jgi:arylsulfatase A-like enzyme